MKPDHDTHHVDIAGYLLDMVGPDEKREVDGHLSDCAECRAEVDAMREWTAALEAVPEPMRLDGPPDDADLLLRRTLRQVRDESSGRRHRRAARMTTVAAAAVVVAAFGGGLVGRVTAPDLDQPRAQPSASAVPGTRTATATDPTTGARISVALVPAAGWVRLTVTVAGIPAGEECRLEVVARNGTAVQAGSWLVSEQGEANGTTLTGSALVPPDQVDAVRVTNTAGRQFVSAGV